VACQSKIEEFGRPVRRDEYVAWLDIAMNQAVPMSFRKCFGNLPEQRRRPVDGKRTIPSHNRVEIRSRDEIHHIVFARRTTRIARRIVTRIQARNDIRMLEPSNCAGFQKKPTHEIGASLTTIGHDLQGNRPSQMTVFRSINDSHPASSDGFHKPVVTDEKGRPVSFSHRLNLKARQKVPGDQR
jgi:hypothetical protein